MIIFEIFFALWWIWLPALVIWLYIRCRNSDRQSSSLSQVQLRDVEWHQYIESFQAVAKTKAEKKLLAALLERRTATDLYANYTIEQGTSAAPNQEAQHYDSSQQSTAPYAAQAQVVKPAPAAIREPIDSTLLLLYFGAFLLVASAGLFVALSTLDGTFRTIVLAVTVALLYMGGLRLYRTSKKLSQAGISFMGTAMMIAPLVGVAWYNLVANQLNGALICLITSLVCFALYAHALHAVQNSFISYLLIGSFISSVESMVLTVSLPTYALAWGLVFTGLVLQVFARRTGEPKKLLDSADTSAQLLVPLSILGSAIAIPQFGSLQLAVTLLLSGSYYVLLYKERVVNRLEVSAAAQLSFIAAVANIVYALSDNSLILTGLALSGITVVYTHAIGSLPKGALNNHSLVPLASVTSVIGTLLTLSDGWSLTASLLAAIVLSFVVWLTIYSKTALAAGGLILLALPFAVGQYALEENVRASVQLGLSAIPAITLACLVAITCVKKTLSEFYNATTILYLISASILVIIAWSLGFEALLATCMALAASFAVLQKISGESGWWFIAGLTLCLPIAQSIFTLGTSDQAFALAVTVGLLLNLLISLKVRDYGIRWMVVGCILLTPLAIGGGAFGFEWAEAGYAVGYLLAMASCVLARAIARGKLLLSSKVPIASYGKDASQAYIVGYVASAAIATFVSLYDDHSRLVTTLVLGVLCATLLFVSFRVESSYDIVAILPVLLQAMLFSAIRPDLSNSLEIGVTAVASTTLACCSYLFVLALPSSHATMNKSLLDVSVITSYLGAGLAFFQSSESSVLLPVSLGLAGVLTYFHRRAQVQSEKELSIGVAIAATHWLIYLLGIHNIHVHTHLLAVFLAGFAVWRFNIGDETNGNNYVRALFYITTIPLALQALGGASADNYGLLLIIQQIGFMLIGSLTNIRFLLKAGLWVALAAILYQLRGLGWAFLTLLALIVIGVAIFRLQRHQDD